MNRFKLNGIIVAAALATWGCGTEGSDDAATTESSRSALGVAANGAPGAPGIQTPRVQVPGVAAAATDSTDKNPITRAAANGHTVTPVDERLVGVHAMADDFPWGKGEDGNWEGTGSPDPAPLQKVTDEEILAAARGDKGTLDERHSAMVSAARRHLPGALDAAAAVLFDTSMDIFSRQVALSALIEHGGGGALSLMWRAFQDPNDRIRGGAVWAIALYGTAEAKKVITAGMADPHPGVQGASILALTAIRNDEVFIRNVLETSIKSDAQQVYQEAAYVLAAIADGRAVKALSEALDASTGNELKRRTVRHYLRAAYSKRSSAGALPFPTAAN